MTNLKETQDQLQRAANNLLTSTSILEKLKMLGDVTQTGSSVTRLMVYPDIDFTIQNDQLDFENAVSLLPYIVSDLKATAVKIANFQSSSDPDAGYYIGFEIPYQGKTWHIDATVEQTGPIVTNPPELARWMMNMSEDERVSILKLKKELIDSKRYVGVKSQPPYTFRSTHLYEGVLRGGAQTVDQLEKYFTKADSAT